MAPVTVSFNDHSATPPIYVAGNFTEWQPVELTATLVKGEQGQDQYNFEKTFDLAPGSYQYKFRLGPGDWWVCDNETQKTQDASGNENNVLVIESEPEKAAAPSAPVAALTSIPDTSASNTAPVAKVTSNHASVTLPHQPAEQVPSFKPTETVQTQASVLTNGIAKNTTQAEEKPTEIATPEFTTKAVNGHAVTPTTAEQVSGTQAVIDEKKFDTQPESKPVDTPTPTKPVEKAVNSENTSVSSNLPKEKIPEKKADEPEKLSWFARIFLCGSSGK